jgi:hypothetical protein
MHALQFIDFLDYRETRLAVEASIIEANDAAHALLATSEGAA